MRIFIFVSDMVSYFLYIEREQYLLNFVGSRLEGGGSSSMLSSTTSSRASTPQPCNYCDFVSIQLE